MCFCYLSVCTGNSIWPSGTIYQHEDRLMFFGFFGWECCSVRLRIRVYERLHLGFCKEADACSFLLVLACLL